MPPGACRPVQEQVSTALLAPLLDPHRTFREPSRHICGTLIRSASIVHWIYAVHRHRRPEASRVCNACGGMGLADHSARCPSASASRHEGVPPLSPPAAVRIMSRQLQSILVRGLHTALCSTLPRWLLAQHPRCPDRLVSCRLQGRSPGRTLDDGLLRSVMGLRGRAEEPPAPAPGSPGKGGDRAALRIAPPQPVAEWDAGRPVVGLHWLSGAALAAACDLGPRTRLTFHDAGGESADDCPSCWRPCWLPVVTHCLL